MHEVDRGSGLGPPLWRCPAALDNPSLDWNRTPAMTRKVIIDCDPGIDDAVALCLALADPRLDVVAVTATAGTVSAEQATRNVQAIIERLDPARHPRIGASAWSEPAGESEIRALHG